MRYLSGSTVCSDSRYAALTIDRDDSVNTQFNRFLNQYVHARIATDSLQQRDGKWRLGCRMHAFADEYHGLFATGMDDTSPIVEAVAVKESQLIIFNQPQGFSDVGCRAAGERYRHTGGQCIGMVNSRYHRNIIDAGSAHPG